MKNENRTFVIGVGMTKFDKPGTKDGDYPDWAGRRDQALADAGIPLRARSSRPSPATCTETRRPASVPSTSSD